MIKLTVELVPRTAWWSNVRSNVSAADWEVCKRFVRDRSGDRCEVCGGRGPKWPVECHEVWDYDDDSGVQTLVDLIALCPDCHEVKHFGLAEVKGRGRKAFAHFCKVNGFDVHQGHKYVDMAFQLWELRSEDPWTLDVSFLSLLGIEVPVQLDREKAHEH